MEKKGKATSLFHLKLLCNPDLNALTNVGWHVAVSTCVHSQIGKTCRPWSLCAIKTPELPKFLHRRFTGIRWWNKGLIFIWQGSQSLAHWSTPCGRPHSHNSLSLLHASGLLNTTFRMHIVPCMKSQFNFHTKNRQKRIVLQDWSMQIQSASKAFSIYDVLHWFTASPACEYILMAISFSNFPFFWV